MTDFLSNAWYVAALGSEIDSARILARTILDDPIILYRDPSGIPVALYDRCPHRFAPLHDGELIDGVVQCAYHGLKFDGSGLCVYNPHGDGAIPDRAKVRAYPLEERYGIVWIWCGEAEAADPNLIPDVSPAVASEPHSGFSGYLHTQAEYELIIDNLMDLSHADYIHQGSLNTGGMLSKIKPKVQTEDDVVEAYWRYEAEVAQPVVRSAIPDPEGRVEQSFRMRWQAPSNLLLWATVRNLDQDVTTTSEAVTAHLLTPETADSTHYFFLLQRNWGKGDAELNSIMEKGVVEAFVSEDKPILQSVKEAMRGEEFWSLDPLILSCDLGPVHARRALARLIRKEKENPALQNIG